MLRHDCTATAGRFGEDGWAAVGSARRRGAGRRQVFATEGWTAADTATAGWAAICVRRDFTQHSLPQVSPFGSRTLLHGGCIAAAGFRANRVLRLRSWSLCRRWRGASHRALPPSSWPLLVACCTPLLGGSCRCNGCQRCLAHTRWIRRRSQRPNAKPNPKPNPKPHPKPDKPNRKPEPNTEPSTLTLTP